MINCGSVRSGKTAVDNDIFVRELKRIRKRADSMPLREEHPQYILAGASVGAVMRNIITPLNNKWGINIKLDKLNSFTLYGVKVTVFGHSKANMEETLTGMEAWGAYVNELTKANEGVFDEILKRCSGSGAKIICDTNPDSPIHWVKKKYVDKADGENIIYNVFLLDENNFLDPEYIRKVKAATPSGVFYERKINARWAAADGVVYEDFNEETHIISEEDFSKLKIVRAFAGQDWGFAETHPGSLITLVECDDGNFYVVNEHSASKKQIEWWVDKAKAQDKKYKEIIIKNKIAIAEQRAKENGEELTDEQRTYIRKNTDNMNIWCDSARPEHVESFQFHDLWAENADKSVLAGVEFIAKLFKTRRLFIVEGVAPQLIENIYNYVWDPRTGKPVKAEDDSADGLRYGAYTELKEEFADYAWEERAA